ncbi:MFS transporter [Cohnella abietis]|uniref:MFS transporter n=1 Tax=Cohnella abietis TaxID=2507935 RepID=A0A3T1D8B0_9BACL|nr:MFS transporter [Cohnella abietis]BBI34322.1 MFS transporter [Cohnella abietis]
MNAKGLVILIWCSLTVVSNVYVTIPIAQTIAQAWENSNGSAGWIGSSFTIAYAAGFLLLGPLAERIGHHRMMLYGLLALAITTSLAGFANSFSLFVSLRVAQGLAASMFAPSVLNYVAANFQADRRTTAIGFISTGFLIAGIVGQLYSGFIAEHFGWRIVFFGLGAVYLLSSILLGKYIQNNKDNALSTLNQTAPAPLHQQINALIKNRALLVCYAITFTVLLSFVGMYTALNINLSQSPNTLSSNQFFSFRAAGVIGMVLSPFAGVLSRRWSVFTLLRTGILLSIVGLLGIFSVQSLPLLVGASVIFVAGVSLQIPSLISVVGQLAVPYRSAGITLYSFVLFCGASIGPLFSLQLLKLSNSNIIFLALAALLAIAFGLSFLVGTRHIANNAASLKSRTVKV